ncbi:hypothetical protein COO60DRAFT_558813 [Scenedesmus sp. NREL 46B-D3]|nr:hypothetical protein COO60DRAFT_558813 [Scenedesmus sp. NREL 46B-D3]
MQLFQQRLQQTALMAQQLLAEQVAGQAARNSSCRPASAAAAPQIADVRAAAASTGVQLTRGLLGSGSGSSCGGGGWLGTRLTPRLAALGVDEPPSAAEVAQYAAYLGMDAQQDAGLLYIAEQALTAPCPEGWTVHLDGDGNEFFHNPTTQASTYEHPMDQHYRELYQQEKLQQQQQLC